MCDPAALRPQGEAGGDGAAVDEDWMVQFCEDVLSESVDFCHFLLHTYRHRYCRGYTYTHRYDHTYNREYGKKGRGAGFQVEDQQGESQVHFIVERRPKGGR